jgi:hypothetical protein
MDIEIYYIDKDLSKKSKYVLQETATEANFVSTSSGGEKVIYITNNAYGKVSIHDELKIVDSKGHVSTLFPTKFYYNGNRIFSGDIKNRDLILLTSANNFERCEIILFKGGKPYRNEITQKLSLGLYNEFIIDLNSK